ncbi:MAG TPA: sulfotransferase [Actinomycetota bacterium]|nr:sulfotransferase [Actinomycetota bacterium]
MSATRVVAPPIFILSGLPRSGTNFLWELVRRHPRCASARPPIWEDYFLKNAGLLNRFASEVQGSWDPVWGSTDHLRPQLLAKLGDAVVDFLSIDPHRRAVTKSPTVANLELFFDVFPRAHLLLLVRDGRDVAASGMRTFGWTLEESASSWSSTTKRILDFVDNSTGRSVRVVRFEDLVVDTESALMDVLSFLDLPADTYDLDLLDEIPVRGSSAYLGPGRSDINWEVQSRPRGFSPIGRWRSWRASDIETFEAIAGEQLGDLGYETGPDVRFPAEGVG